MFAANETAKVITINVAGDTAVEPDETFRVTLSGASGGATIVTAAANGTIINDDITFGQLPLACSVLHVGDNTCTISGASGLQTEDVEPILKQALAFWRANGLTAAELQLLQQITVQVKDLAGSGLGQNVGTTISVDANAADFGWFVDATPGASEEFVRRRTKPGQPFLQRELFARENGPADQRMDLLTVVLHEIGNVLGRQSSSTSAFPLMDPTLSAGVGKLPPHAVDAVFAQQSVAKSETRRLTTRR